MYVRNESLFLTTVLLRRPQKARLNTCHLMSPQHCLEHCMNKKYEYKHLSINMKYEYEHSCMNMKHP